MAFTEGKKNEHSLDDSLTNIQWLCGLESSTLLQSRQNSGQESRTNVMSADSPNPYPKPPYSYATMILLAINSTEDKKMTLQDIYKWIETNFPYYKKCKKAWKNSIRHNLSLHSFFLKEKRPLDLPGKGSYWSISPEGKKNIMQEVMKHAQPVVHNPLAYPGPAVGRNLRPILPKPTGEVQTCNNNDGVPGVCSFMNGNTVMPVVILPTNVYVELASKIANNKKSDFTVTQGQDSTIQVIDGSQQFTKSPSNNGSAFSDLMEEILRNENFSEALDTIKNESITIEIKNQEISEPTAKKIKKEDKENDVYPIHQSKQTPLKDRSLPTLAAMNGCNESGILLDKDLNSLVTTPMHLSTPKATMMSSKSSAVQSTSPLARFHSGLTPLKYDSDSGFFTPLKETDFDFLLSPNHMILDQLTPARFNSTPQGCRKSLKLGTVQEEVHDGISWI